VNTNGMTSGASQQVRRLLPMLGGGLILILLFGFLLSRVGARTTTPRPATSATSSRRRSSEPASSSASRGGDLDRLGVAPGGGQHRHPAAHLQRGDDHPDPQPAQLVLRAHGRMRLRPSGAREAVEKYGGENWYVTTSATSTARPCATRSRSWTCSRSRTTCGGSATRCWPTCSPATRTRRSSS